MTGKEVMRLYLIENNGREIDYYIIQNELPEFASKFGVYHTPDSWTRYFRMVKDEFNLIEIPGRKWKTWRQEEMRAKMTLDEWIVNGQVGVSSKTMWSAIKGVARGNERLGVNFDIPYDPDDFCRCYGLYTQCNLTKSDLQKVADTFKWWKPFVDNWDKLVGLWLEESPKQSCPKLYDFMQKLVEEARILDGWVRTSPHSWERKKVSA